LGQFGFVAEQLAVLLLPWQEIVVVESQATVAVQRAFSWPTRGRFAATGTSAGGAPQEPSPEEGPRIIWRAAGERRVGEDVWAKPTGETRRRTQARVHGFFIVSPCFTS
jgi:hypothetical protein